MESGARTPLRRPSAWAYELDSDRTPGVPAAWGRVEGIMPAIVDIEELGRRIRKLRLERRMTLKQVEHVSGLSATHLSEIERGRTSPTIGALVRIARALEKDASYFIEQEERSDIAHHLREDVQRFAFGDGVTAEALSPGIPGSGLFTYRIRMDGRPDVVLRLAAQELPGDSIYFVQAGTVTAGVGENQLTLTAGDAMQASLEHEHRVSPAGRDGVEILLATTRNLEAQP